MVDQLADLFHTTHKVKTQQVVKNRGHHCGDIELACIQKGLKMILDIMTMGRYLINSWGCVPQ
jgi:hypothetical protein